MTIALVVSLVVRLPLALGGEAEGANNIGLGLISLVSIVLGWLALGALWWFVFRDKERSKRKKRSPE
jgi:hypothetical protein